MKKNKLISEFFRYAVVGGSAFLIDYSLLYIFQNLVFYRFEGGIYFSTAIGFIAGLVFNYILSLKFVFESAAKENKGKTFGAFLIFAIIGVTGLLLTELGMYLHVEILGMNYMLAKLIVAAVILIWNYAMRKLLIFR